MVKAAQLSIFNNRGTRPCEYSFDRYIGQKVDIMIGSYYDGRVEEGTVIEIRPYYTVVKVGKEYLAGTPYNLSEAE